MKHANIAIFIPHLGCPYQCIFCQQNKISHQGEAPSPSEIAPILENALSTIDKANTMVEAAFFGGSFTALPQAIQESYLKAVQPYLKRGLIESIRLSTRPDCIDRAILEMLDSYGVKTIEIGVQSFSDKVLAMSGRGYNASQVYAACRLIKEGGFDLGIQLMVGLPGSSRSLDYTSTLMAIEQHPDFVRIYPTLVIRDTELEILFKAEDYQTLTLEEAVEICKEMFLAFQLKRIPVVRMGLHPGEELRSPGTVVAGPYHAAFGELVQQEIFKEQASRLITDFLQQNPKSGSLILMLNPKDLSKLLGWRRRNLLYLKSIAGLSHLETKAEDKVCREELLVQCSDKGIELGLSRKQFLCQRPGIINSNPNPN